MNIEPPTPSGQPPQPHPCAASLADALGKLLSQLSTALGDFDGVGQDLGHLEESLKKPMAQFQSRVLEAAAQRRADQAEPICPRCARPLTRRQKLARSILTSQGEIELARVRGWCGKRRAWRCPADEALGVEGGHSPLVRGMAALFASKMPLAEASVALGRARKGARAMITHRGYVATRGGLEEFRAQLHAEALRHGLGQAGRVLVMGDGAAWIWNLAKDRFQGAAQRVDLYHVKEHLWAVARELRPNDPGGADLWVRRQECRRRRWPRRRAQSKTGFRACGLPASSGAASRRRRYLGSCNLGRLMGPKLPLSLGF